jgi:hypothetical protein
MNVHLIGLWPALALLLAEADAEEDADTVGLALEAGMAATSAKSIARP